MYFSFVFMIFLKHPKNTWDSIYHVILGKDEYGDFEKKLHEDFKTVNSQVIMNSKFNLHIKLVLALSKPIWLRVWV